MVTDTEPIIKYWLQIAGQIQVELVEMKGMCTRLQINLDEVIFYRLSLEGRPDDLLMRGYDSWLNLCKRVDGAGTENRDKDFAAAERSMKRLMQEILLYFPRVLAYLKMGEFKSSAYDVHHCLAIIRYVLQRPASASTLKFLQLAPIMHMLYYLALSAMSLERGHYRRALAYLRRGMQRIEADHIRLGENARFPGYGELVRMRVFKRLIIAAFRRRKSGARPHDLSAPADAWKTQPQVQICHLLSSSWR